MKFYKIIITILIVFFKTGNLLSENNLFNVNNIQLEKKDKISIKNLANNAIKKGFTQLLSRILLSEDKSKKMNTDVFYTITNDSLIKNIQKSKVERLFFQHSELSLKPFSNSLVKLNSLQPYYLVEFTKRLHKIC